MPEEVVAAEKPSAQEEQKVKSQKKAKTFINKVVIRRLPPNLNCEQFIETVSPLPDYYEFYFVPADWSLGAESTSRAYIEFKNQEDIFLFKEKFDDYVFVDQVKGTEYPAIVEYAPFQGLPKSRARKRDKNVGTIENEQHFLNFLDMLKNDETETKAEPKLEYSYQIKNDKKITSTPLLEYLAAAKEEKREAKKKKIEEKKKQREEEKHKKKQQTAKNIPEPIKESKEEVVYEDGIMVRTVPSRLGRNDKSSNKKDSKSDKKSEKDAADKEKREERKKQQQQRKLEKDQQKAKDRDAQKPAKNSTDKKLEAPPTDDSSKSSQQPKREVKRYSELRKARQEPKELDTAESSIKPVVDNEEIQPDSEVKGDGKSEKEDPRFKRIQELREKRNRQKEERKLDKAKANDNKKSKDKPSKESPVAEPENIESAPDDSNQPTVSEEDHRWKRIKELREQREREKDERAQRQIRNKDRPSMQIYRPKRVDAKGDSKSSDENSESTKKRDSKDERKPSKRDTREERNRRKKNIRKTSSEIDDISEDIQAAESQVDSLKSSKSVDEAVSVKMEQLSLDKEIDVPEKTE